MNTVASLVENINFQLPFGRWQLFEFCDLYLVPETVKHCCQNTLTAQWTKRLPFIQQQAPAELAADAVLEALNSINDIDTADWTVIDFCSGAGGPIPFIETLVNDSRKQEGKKPIAFRLSDLHPNLDAWMRHAALSEHLSFIPQPVDAGNPPFSVISATMPGDKEAASKLGFVSNGSKVFRLFCLSFHHFDDPTARRVLKSTLETSEAFAIIELQDRRIGTLCLMTLEYLLVLLITMFWFSHDPLQLLLTYAIPVLPIVHSFDGLVSCLRTRTFEETIRLVEDAQGGKAASYAQEAKGSMIRRRNWHFSHVRALHTWPFGYMEITFGRRVESSSRKK